MGIAWRCGAQLLGPIAAGRVAIAGRRRVAVAGRRRTVTPRRLGTPGARGAGSRRFRSVLMKVAR